MSIDSARALRTVTVIVFAAAIVVAAGCNGQDDDEASGPSNTGDGLVSIGLTSDPPDDLRNACRALANKTDLTVFCPPVVPQGPVEVQGNGTGADSTSYALSLDSASLVDEGRAADYNAERPFDWKPANPTYYPGRPRNSRSAWHPYHASHWVVFAGRPAGAVREQVDLRILYPGVDYATKPSRFEVNGVTATVLQGDIAGRGIMSADHVIITWTHRGVGYLASVHFDEHEDVARGIARGLIRSMTECEAGQAQSDSLCSMAFE